MNGACAHCDMVSKFQWKPYWLATQLYLQNASGGWQFRLNDGIAYDVFTRGPILGLLRARKCSAFRFFSSFIFFHHKTPLKYQNFLAHQSSIRQVFAWLPGTTHRKATPWLHWMAIPELDGRPMLHFFWTLVIMQAKLTEAY